MVWSCIRVCEGVSRIRERDTMFSLMDNIIHSTHKVHMFCKNWLPTGWHSKFILTFMNWGWRIVEGHFSFFLNNQRTIEIRDVFGLLKEKKKKKKKNARIMYRHECEPISPIMIMLPMMQYGVLCLFGLDFWYLYMRWGSLRHWSKIFWKLHESWFVIKSFQR